MKSKMLYEIETLIATIIVAFILIRSALRDDARRTHEVHEADTQPRDLP